MKLIGVMMILSAVLTACAQDPRIESATPGSVSILGTGFGKGEQAAADLAQKHCQKYGKNAVIHARNWSAGDTIYELDYQCK